MAQTIIQNQKALIPGSGVVYVGEDFDSLVNIGAYRDFVYNHKAETATISFDNVDDIKRVKNFDKASFEFKLAEIDSGVWSLFNKGLLNVEYVDGTPVSVSGEAVVMKDNKVNLLQNKNADGSRVDISAVKSADGSTTYTEGTDYEVVVNPEGYTGLVIVQGGGINDGDIVIVDYTYTPAQARKISFASSGIVQPIVARFVHTDNKGKQITIDLVNVSNIKTLGIDFVGDNDDDVATMEIELEGYIKSYTDEITV